MSNNLVVVSPVASRAVARFRRMLADLFADEATVARYREADAWAASEPDDDPDAGMCRRACGMPAQYNGECWSCNAGRVLP